MILWLLLVLLGIAWGLQVPLTKVAVEAGYRDVGIIFWQSAIDVLLLAPFAGRLPLCRKAIAVYLFVGLVGTLLPAASSAVAAVHLPAGIVALGLSFVPLAALPIAVALGTDRFTLPRIAGLLAGLAGVVVMISPGAGLAAMGLSQLFLLALIAPAFYAIEGNVLARWGSAGLRPVQMVTGASAVSALIAGPAATWRGSFIAPTEAATPAGMAVVGSGMVSVVAYVGYLWMVGRAGAVFAAQVAYLVTGFGVLWSMALLGERFAPGFWLALAVVMGGVFLVRPRVPALRPRAESDQYAPNSPDSGRDCET